MNIRALTAICLSAAAICTLHAPPASAAWASSHTGTGNARADTLATPTGFVTATSNCKGTTSSATFSWTAVSGAEGYDVTMAADSSFTKPTTSTVTGPSASFANSNKTTYVTVLASNAKWHGQPSAVQVFCP